MLVDTVLLAPLVVLGAFAGVRLARRMAQSYFDIAVLAASAVSALVLVLA